MRLPEIAVKDPMSSNDKTKRFEIALCNYCNATEVRKLSFGCGDNVLPGWFNTDLNEQPVNSIYYIDMTHSLPINDETFDYIELEHNIEHLGYMEGTKLIRECYRILKIGGIIRIVTPDLERLVKIYQSKSSKANEYRQWMLKDYIDEEPLSIECIPAIVLNNSVRAWGHKFIYDETTLKSTLAHIGFKDIRRHKTGRSDDKNLRGIERHLCDRPDLQVYNEYETFAIEGTK